eukprot:CAMPEP_0184863144 /NCGR_PEP_ID=MMETSP0580-20130426/9303_1 /TAXON_ID=1118495 /ORGANISM="Dactyliosolen fragilissimus" /LENGTH=379 /DNA_ID=CAMNT_0027361279 /DNA_START=63 /DNA_END=1199 /DNA_ORIENTATION=-
MSSSSLSPPSSFQFVRIPAQLSCPIEQLSGSKAGGLSDDHLVKYAKNYFLQKRTKDGKESSTPSSMLENASPEERQSLINTFRQKYSQYSSLGSTQSQQPTLNDDVILSMIKQSSSSATCDILALTVPTQQNAYKAVSMYVDDMAQARAQAKPQNESDIADTNMTDFPIVLNQRASLLLKACGHAMPTPNGVYGDVFVGRCHDDEMGDVWERIDFVVQDATIEMMADHTTRDRKESIPKWCIDARKRGGGGGSAPSFVHGSQSHLQTQASSKPTPQRPSLAASSNSETMEQTENGYKWSQTAEEVEVKFTIPAGTKSKQVQVHFQRNSLKVVVCDKILCHGDTWAPLSVEDCTYTIQDDNNGNRELCLTLGKSIEGEHW